MSATRCPADPRNEAHSAPHPGHHRADAIEYSLVAALIAIAAVAAITGLGTEVGTEAGTTCKDIKSCVAGGTAC